MIQQNEKIIYSKDKKIVMACLIECYKKDVENMRLKLKGEGIVSIILILIGMLVELAAWVTLENRAIVCILILLFIFNTVNLTYRYVKLAAKYKSEINKLEELKKELGDETDD